MKTERRHELQTNDLADHLGRSLKQIQPYSSVVTLAILGVLGAVAAAVFFSRQSAEESAVAWEDYFTATEEGRDLEKLQAIAKKYPDTALNDWAQLAAADDSMQRGMALLTRDKHGARVHLTTAAERYRELSKNGTIEAARQRATFNLALAYESLGKVSEAEEAYAAVTGALAEVAQARAAELTKNKKVQTFYDWFAKAEAPTAFRPEGGAPVGERPDFGVEAPTDSPFRLPVNIDDPTPNGVLNLPSGLGGLVPKSEPAPATTDGAAEAPEEESKPTEGVPPVPPEEPAAAESKEEAAKAESDESDTPAEAPTSETAGAPAAPASAETTEEKSE